MTTATQQQTRTVHFYYPPFVVDMFLRWLSMGVYRGIEDNDQHNTSEFIVFATIQLVITAITTIWVFVRFHNLKNNYEFLREGYYEEKVSLLSIAFRIFNVLSVTYILSGAIQEQSFYRSFVGVRPESEAAVYIIVFLVYAGIITYLSFSSISIPKEQEKEFTASIPLIEPFPIGKWVRKLTKKDEKTPLMPPEIEDKSLFIDNFDYQIDHNDLEIIKVEGRLRNEHSRVEAYILESVMFGALAFSGFLSIIASERFNLTLQERVFLADTNAHIIQNVKRKERKSDGTEVVKSYDETIPIAEEPDYRYKKVEPLLDIKNPKKVIPIVKNTEMRVFWSEAINLLKNILLFKFNDDTRRSWNRLLQPSNLIMLISIETLFCALFFLSVIASRLRYTKMTEEIDNLVRLARNFNEKEEEVHNLILQGLGDESIQANLRRRLQSLSLKINQYVSRANELMEKARPILVYMSLFRNLGVITFIFILITSCIFFSETLAFIFLLFSIIAYVYEYVDIKLRMKGR
ncbi:MAG: hypothetical protein RMJ97_04160 [Raineya sp.]|nr:hypothetical protein [Raineya sp.]MDW8296058.1 hypothetical protein [Raineya sp.]